MLAEDLALELQIFPDRFDDERAIAQFPWREREREALRQSAAAPKSAFRGTIFWIASAM